MKTSTLVRREIFERKSQLATAFLSVLLGICVIVAVRTILFYSEKAVARELDALGANILILPKSSNLQDYYSADLQEETFPEDYVARLLKSDIKGLDNLSPKVSAPIVVNGRRFTLTGILPKDEFKAKASWQGAGVFGRPEGCGVVVDVPCPASTKKSDRAVQRKVITTLEKTETLLGSELALFLKVKAGENLRLFNRDVKVVAVLPSTGTIDDFRAFIHLHVAQELTHRKNELNAIEIVGCCDQISKGLVATINKLLPDAKVVTVTQIVDTQIKTNRLMASLSWLTLAVIVLLGGAGIANYMVANVTERTREIGTLMAMGAGRQVILRLFLLKALGIGLAGGVSGSLLGSAVAMIFGPSIAGSAVFPMPWLCLGASALGAFVSLAASYLPALNAAKMDPSTALREL
jgi:putative ABC transport system permease protein